MNDYYGILTPAQIQMRQTEHRRQIDWGGGVTMAEKLGFVMQYKPGDKVLVQSMTGATPVHATIVGAMEWGAYQLTFDDGPVAGQTQMVAWNYVVPLEYGGQAGSQPMGGGTKMEKKDPTWNLLRDAVKATHPHLK